MRILQWAALVGVGCVGVDVPESEDPASVSDPEDYDGGGCRGCSSTPTTPPVEAYTVELSFMLDTGDRPPERRDGVFYAVVTAADLPDDPPLADIALPLVLNDHYPSLDVGLVEVYGSTHFRLTGFFDVDGDADPNDPQASEGDPITVDAFDLHWAREGYADPMVYLEFVDE